MKNKIDEAIEILREATFLSDPVALNDRIEKAFTRLKSERVKPDFSGDWKLTTTPPRSGKMVLLYDPEQDGTSLFIGYFDSLNECWYSEFNADVLNPTHWMEKPLLPQDVTLERV